MNVLWGLVVDSELWFQYITQDSWKMCVSKCGLSSSVLGATLLMQEMADKHERKKCVY